MKKLIVILLIGLGVFAAIQNKDRWFNSARDLVSHNPLTDALTQTLNQESTLPGPLRIWEEKTTRSFLTVSGVVQITNQERAGQGLHTLKVNDKLAAAARAKLKDMFDRQYFEHISPTGEGPSSLAKDAGYAYVIVGENLALGNFKDDDALVDGWMNSPGHRANILNTKYTEIGVAVGQGIFEGKKTWLAVQEFGSPLSSCPAVDATLKTSIQANETQIRDWESSATVLKQELESGKYDNDPDSYNARVREYNELVKRINGLIDEAKELVAKYNAQVNAFNACIKD